MTTSVIVAITMFIYILQANRASVSYEPFTEGEKEDIQRQVRQYLDGTLTEIEVTTKLIRPHTCIVEC